MAPHTCIICGNTDFDELDGRFFCTECSTQSQDFHVQETGDHDFQNSSQYTKRMPTLSQQTSTPSSKETVFGRPWNIYEAYQYIILAQVDALMALGASQHLKDIVYLVWANYLRKLGVAFCAREKLVPDIVLQTGYCRHRDLNRGSFENPRIRTVHYFNKSKSERLLNGDDDNEDEEDSIIVFEEPVLKVLKQGKCIHEGTKRQRRQVAKSHPEWMTLQKTITFCYIGLMLTDSLLLPHDIIRLIYEGKIPFLTVSHILPQDMVMQDMDHELFEVRAFDASHLRHELHKILSFLSLEDMPSLKEDRLISRFVDDLALPNEMKSLCIRLTKTFPFHLPGYSLYYKADYAALAYIITVLSLVWGLDETTESELSDCTRKLQSLIGPEPKLFAWDEWRNFTSNRFHKKFDSCVQFSQPFHKSDVRHVGSLVDCFDKIGRSKRKCSTFCLNKNLHFNRRYRSEVHDGLVNPIQEVLDRINAAEQFTTDPEKQQQKNQSDDEQMEYFKASTFCHISDADSFRQKFAVQVQAGGEEADILLQYFKTRPKTFTPYKQNETRARTQEARSSQNDGSDNCEPIAWLGNVCSQLVGCSQHHLNHAVKALHGCVLLKNSGKAGNIAATSHGPMPVGRKIKSRCKKRNETVQ